MHCVMMHTALILKRHGEYIILFLMKRASVTMTQHFGRAGFILTSCQHQAISYEHSGVTY